MKLAIFGSTGGTGRRLVAQALEQGHTVTAFARKPGKLNIEHENLRVVESDVLDYDAVEGAVRGQDAVLVAIGMPAMDKSKLRSRGTKNIIGAMEKTSVKRLIVQSTFGVGDSHDALPFSYKRIIFPLILRHALADHEEQERIIKNSTLDWIIVRPGALTNGERTGAYWHGFVTDSKSITSKISRADTADFMLRQLEDDAYLGKSPVLSYPKRSKAKSSLRKAS